MQLFKRIKFKEFWVTQIGYMEKPKSGFYQDFWEDGEYTCVVCDETLFDSSDKIENKKMAAFSIPIGDVAIVDNTRTFFYYYEARCQNCGSILGEFSKKKVRGVLRTSYLIGSHSVKFIPRYELTTVFNDLV